MKSCFAAKQRDLPAFAMRHIKKTKTGAFFCLRELVSFDAKCALLMRDYVAVQLFACCLSFATSHDFKKLGNLAVAVFCSYGGCCFAITGGMV